jgi:hypothetical protein
MTEQQEAFRRIAKARFDEYVDFRGRAFDAQVQYGRWILNSLLLINGGSILAITQTGPLAARLFRDSGSWFIAGIAFTFVAAGAAWLNWSWVTKLYDEWAEPAMIEHIDHWPKDNEMLGARINASRFASIAFSIFALYCPVAGASEILKALRASIT